MIEPDVLLNVLPKRLGFATRQVPIRDTASGFVVVLFGGAGLTVTETFTVAPCVIVVGASDTIVVVVGVKLPEEGQAASRFPTLMDPNPAAKSYPVPVANAGLAESCVAEIGISSSPIVEDDALLQSTATPPLQGTELLPTVMSWNTLGFVAASEFNS